LIMAVPFAAVGVGHLLLLLTRHFAVA
jgi:hypothetical protein